MRGVLYAFSLAMRDYRHESLLSACAVLGLAAVLAPLMVLLGVHHGVISAMTERLMNDPRTLEVSPVGSGKYGPDWFTELAALPETAFAIPQTRSIAATMNLHSRDKDSPKQSVSPIIATDKGDPLLLRWKQPEAGWENAEAGPPEGSNTAGVMVRAVLSESLARKLAAKPGDVLDARVDRVRSGKRESAELPLRVLSVLPPEAFPTDMAFVPLELLVATEDYRDGKAVAFLGWDGNASAIQMEEDKAGNPQELLAQYARHIREQREYASFRLYAKNLDDVAPLWRWFQQRHVEVYVKSAEIDTVKSLDRAFTLVFSLITGAAMFGFVASTASNALAGVKRKSRSLGILRLIGFSRSGILLFPLAQTCATGLFGAVLASGLYLGVAYSIDSLFSSSLPGGETVCSLPPSYVAAVFVVVLLLSALASLSAAWQATTIEPSEVIRDV